MRPENLAALLDLIAEQHRAILALQQRNGELETQVRLQAETSTEETPS